MALKGRRGGGASRVAGLLIVLRGQLILCSYRKPAIGVRTSWALMGWDGMGCDGDALLWSLVESHSTGAALRYICMRIVRLQRQRAIGGNTRVHSIRGNFQDAVGGAQGFAGCCLHVL